MSQTALPRFDPVLDVLPPAGPAATDPLPAGPARSRRLALLGQILRFGMVGGLGFVWDAGTVYALSPELGLYAAAIAAYLVAATMNWLLNRFWTFRRRDTGQPWLRQWASFLAANSVGFALNRSVFFALVWTSEVCAAHLVVPLAIGALAGMCANFTLSRRLVFVPSRAGRVAES